MDVKREGENVIVEQLNELKGGDAIECDTFEHLVKLCKDLAHEHIGYRQYEPLVVTIV